MRFIDTQMITNWKKKNTLQVLITFFLISLAALIVILTALVIIDIKQNGFTTLSLSTSPVIVSTSQRSYSFVFAAKDNYLGSMNIPITVKKNGQVQFKLKEKNTNTWYYQASYNTTGIQQLPNYPFGFPVIANSKNKQYQVVLEPSKSTPDAQVSLSSVTIVTRYFYPKAILLQNKKILIGFLIHKYLGSFSFSTLVISLLVGLFLVRPKSIFLRLKPVWEKTISESGQEKIYRNVSFIFLFLYFFYSNLVQMNFFVSLLWLLGFCIFYFLISRTNQQLFFIMPLFLYGLLLIFLITKDYITAGVLTGLLWVFLFAAVLQFFLNLLFQFFKNKETKFIKKRILILFFSIASLIFLISALNKTYQLGGDDSRLYFLYPHIYFQNFAITNGLNGGVSSVINLLPNISIAPFTIFNLILKTVFGSLNIQMMLFALNIIGGIVFFYILLRYLFQGKQFEYFIARIIASLFYVFSIFNFYTLLNSLLMAQFLISMFPLSMYLYIKGIKERKYYLLCLCAVIWSVFSFVLISLPWFAGAFIAFIPFLIFFFWKEKKNFIIFNIFFAFILFMINAYWIVALSHSSVSDNSISTNSSVVSTQFRNQNSKGIIDTAQVNKVFFPLVNLYHYDIQNNFQWPYLPIFNSWYLKLLIFNSTFFIFILWIGIKIQNNPFRKAYISAALSFLLTIYLFTVNIGNAGINVFVFLNNYIPGFVMFRNMYDKFGYAFALSFALLLFICLSYFLTSKINLFYKRIVVVFFSLLILLNALPFLLGEFYSLPVWTTKNTYPTTTALNQDYMNVVAFIRQQSDTSRYLWLPLNSGNISQIQDNSLNNHFYNGVSPLLLLSGKNDYSGLLSFGNLEDEIENDLIHKDYQKLGEIYQQNNIRYIIVNNTITNDIKQGYICNHTVNICNLQDKEYRKFFLGKKIKNFGSRYTLYEINPRFFNQTLYLTQNISEFPKSQTVTYQKISNEEYLVHLSHLQSNEMLVFLNPYYSNWKLFFIDNSTLIRADHTKVFGYANVWDIDKDTFVAQLPTTDYIKNSDGSININIRLRFVQNEIEKILISLAVVVYAAIFVYTLIVLLRQKFWSKLYYEIRKK